MYVYINYTFNNMEKTILVPTWNIEFFVMLHVVRHFLLPLFHRYPRAVCVSEIFCIFICEPHFSHGMLYAINSNVRKWSIVDSCVKTYLVTSNMLGVKSHVWAFAEARVKRALRTRQPIWGRNVKLSMLTCVTRWTQKLWSNICVCWCLSYCSNDCF